MQIRTILPVLAGALLSSTIVFADTAVCTAQCDTSVSYQQMNSGGKMSGGGKMTQITHTALVQTVGRNVEQAFEKLSKKCSGRLYAGKTEFEWTPVTIQNSCDND